MTNSEKRIGELEAQVKRLKLVQYVTGEMNFTKEDNKLLELMLEQCIHITGATSGSIMRKSKDGEELHWAITRGLDPKMVANTVIKIGEGVTGMVVKEGVPKLINEVQLEPRYISVKADVKSELAVPLKNENDIIGVISVDSDKNNAFNEHDLDLLQAIANQAAQIFSKKLLYENLNRKIKLKDILLDISNQIENMSELKEIFELTMQKLADEFNISRGMLVLFEEQDINKLSVYTAYNLTEEEMSRGNYQVGEGIIGTVVESGRPISIPNIYENNLFLNRMQVKRNKNIPISFIAVPIKIEGIVNGVIAIEKAFESLEGLKDIEDMMMLIGNMLSNKIRAFQRVLQERQALLDENRQLKKELLKNYGKNNIIGKNEKMQEVFDLVDLVADSQSSILILGESGTGKELIAKALHLNSSRQDQPFISLNCAAIPENLLESELFGHKRGSFTGASGDKKGKFQLAHKGTLFLDEIGDMPLTLQAKLLRAIQEKEIEPLGSEQKIKVDIRLISATNKDLKKLIKDGLFREDLYYRLDVIEIKMPPLRERRDDIVLLVEHFIRKYAVLNNRQSERLSPEVLRILQHHNWPGNVRELENVIERAVLLTRGKTIEESALPEYLSRNTNENVSPLSIGRWLDSYINNDHFRGEIYESVISYIEKELITHALLYNKRNKIQTAAFLGINRNTLRSKMSRYGINV